jgi:uncharacterized protein
MKRKINNTLIEWANTEKRKPLIINGARQIGKSWAVKELGRTHFKEKFCEINFERTPQLSNLFEKDLDVKRIIAELEVTLNVELENGNTLLFLDEIQNCPKAIMALRYFYEDLPNIPVVAAGSLLEFQLKYIPFPVGRITQLEMHPMDFEEFLMAQENVSLLKKLKEPPQALSAVLEQKLYEELQNYFWVGGMPECVQHFVNHKSYAAVRKLQEDLLYSYYQDFSKYNPLVNKDCLNDILANVANNIGNQVIYTKLSERFTGPTIKKGVEVLSMAKVIKTIQNVSLAGLPFTTSGKQYKLSFIDIGLLLCLNRVAYENLFSQKNLNNLFTGAWAEQFIAQQLLCAHKNIYYWARAAATSSAEVDYVVETNGEIIPIEVKFGSFGKLKSLHILLNENKNIKKAVVFSKAPFGIVENIHFIPMYYAGINSLNNL